MKHQAHDEYSSTFVVIVVGFVVLFVTHERESD